MLTSSPCLKEGDPLPRERGFLLHWGCLAAGLMAPPQACYQLPTGQATVVLVASRVYYKSAGRRFIPLAQARGLRAATPISGIFMARSDPGEIRLAWVGAAPVRSPPQPPRCVARPLGPPPQPGR